MENDPYKIHARVKQMLLSGHQTGVFITQAYISAGFPQRMVLYY